jgi:hypothetical protein
MIPTTVWSREACLHGEKHRLPRDVQACPFTLTEIRCKLLLSLKYFQVIRIFDSFGCKLKDLLLG